jgi:hypothetical protein
MSVRAADDGTSEPDELQLPVLGLYADLEMGRGSVLLPDEFLHCSSLVQLEIIGQWQHALARYQRQALQQLQQDLATAWPELGAAELHALLRSTCESLRIEVPADLAGTPARP